MTSKPVFSAIWLLGALLLQPQAAEAYERSRVVRAEFQRTHPCPATHARRGACYGYQVDHVIPLKCGGPDRVENLQWLTVADHARKTAREARLCRHRSSPR